MPQDTPPITIDPQAYLANPAGNNYAYGRVTQAPIQFGQIGSPSDNFSGFYTPGPIGGGTSLLHLLLHPQFLNSAMQNGLIKVNPYSNDRNDTKATVGDTVRHESIHQLLSKSIGDDTLSQLVNSVPNYADYIRPSMYMRSGDRDMEAPAYMGVYNPREVTASYPARMDFLNAFVPKLNSINSKAAQKYSKLAGIPPPDAGQAELAKPAKRGKIKSE